MLLKRMSEGKKERKEWNRGRKKLKQYTEVIRKEGLDVLNRGREIYEKGWKTEKEDGWEQKGKEQEKEKGNDCIRKNKGNESRKVGNMEGRMGETKSVWRGAAVRKAGRQWENDCQHLSSQICLDEPLKGHISLCFLSVYPKNSQEYSQWDYFKAPVNNWTHSDVSWTHVFLRVLFF